MTKVRKSSPPTTEEEKGEVIESGPPLQLGEERILDASSVKKKLHKHGIGWETPKHGAEATVHYVGTLLDGKIFNSTRNDSEPVILTVKVDEVGPLLFLEKCIMTMTRGELSLFTMPADLGYGAEGYGSIIKKILKKGNKDGRPRYLDEVLVKYQVELLDGTVVAKSPDEDIEFCVEDVSYVAKLEDGTIFEMKEVGDEEPFVFVTDEEQVISGLDKAAAKMKKREKEILTISPEYGFGNVEVQRDHAKFPQCSVLIYEVEMEKRPREMSNEEKIKTANRKKEEGNLLYKNQKYQRAAKKYNKAADCIEKGSFKGDEEKQVKDLRVSCFLNGEACSLKLKDFLETIGLCSEVLDIEFQNVKALYRRAQSSIKLGDFNSAEMDIKKALEADPENREVKSLYRTLKQSKAKSNKRDAKLYANMFALSKKLKLMEAEEEKMVTNVEITEHSNEQSS